MAAMSQPLSGKIYSAQTFPRSPRGAWSLRLVAGWLGLMFLLILSVPGELAGQTSLRDEDLRILQGTPLEKDFDDMLFHYLVRQAEEAAEKRRARLEAVKSEADFRNWQEANRRKFLELIGGLPAERTPLNARVVGELPREGYVVRKVIFESLPEFYVTANLYVPTTGQPPYPAVLSPVGHARNGKAYEVYQRLFIGLVTRGYVVLTWDPLGQGERLEYWDFLSGRRRFEFNQHAMAGIQQYLLGQNLARYFIWDGLRALDYLTSLPEVDGNRIGVTGNSGGGTLTTYISMLDPRVKVASIVTFISSIPKKIENRINDAESDPEQDVQGLLAAGIDHPEFVGMIAPRPVLIGAAVRDFFPIEGTRQTFKELQELYRKLGFPERVMMVEFDHRHMYSQPLREATTAWFERWLKGTESEVHEPAITPEPDSVLQCTASGQAVVSLAGKRVYDFSRVEAERLVRKLERQRRSPDFLRGLPAKIRQYLALPSAPIEPRPRELGGAEVNNLTIERVLLETEPGIVVPTRLVFLKGLAERMPAVVYLRDRTGQQDAPEIFDGLARQGRMVAVADVRGFGETRSPRNVPEEGVDYFDPRDGMDADFAYAGLFLGRPLLGMRVWDALHLVAYLRTRSDVDPKRISIAGRGWVGLVAAFAGAVDPGISAVAAEGAAASYSEIARRAEYQQAASLLLAGVLRDFDLEDVLATLAPRPLLVLNPTDALTRNMRSAEARAVLAAVRRAYQGAPALEVRVDPFESEACEILKRWLLEH